MIVFDGKMAAEEILQEVKEKTKKLTVKPKLVSIVVGDHKGALFYQNLKKKKAAEVGIEIEIKYYFEDTEFEDIKKDILKLNKDESVDGVMIQLPLPKDLRGNTKDLIQYINKKKDVDGMREDSDYICPVVKAVIKAFQTGLETLGLESRNLLVLVIGNTGFEGGKMYTAFKDMGYSVTGVNKKTKELRKKTKKADVVVSATGVTSLIKPDMIRDGAILIDVGSPKGDIEKAAYKKAGFVSPVPGGVGPMTIAYLMENIYEASKLKKD
ncbi:bifunctional 5,10-methylenetetrahydrofolate dehydrogenase/5,10-methenyltetrahydrofolate cyclohydrolase [Candidatus Woesebacteria bacterium]|nr:bifunctional 5,10-methylenetetrahydrofolate dehydrogenase/5,10-methenyltetrahydrofolate cyclohydrolase [Candidatus Woesebacteria bacterium]